MFGRFSPEEDREYIPTGISNVKNDEDLIYEKLNKSGIAGLCSNTINPAIFEEVEEYLPTEMDPRKLKESHLRKYQQFAPFFTQYKKYICPKKDLLILSDTTNLDK